MRYIVRLAVGLAAGVAACASWRHGGSVAEPRVVRSGAPSSVAPADEPTVSPAIDRVSKRLPGLTGSAGRAGTGRGVMIYVFDGGVAENHPELAGRVRLGFDAFPGTPRICNGHGTAVAGAAAGKTLGVAPDARIVDVKIINCATTHGTLDAIVAAARWVAADRREHPDMPAIANWSFVIDTTGAVPGIDTAISILHDAGLLVVVSAGNYDIDACRVSPANSHRALVVGASALVPGVAGTAPRDVRARSTAWGRCIDVYAPGDSVPLPALQDGQPATAAWNGTSMAAGFVSGAAAVLLEIDPRMTPDALAHAIEARATPNAVDERIAVAGAPRGRLLYIGSAP